MSDKTYDNESSENAKDKFEKIYHAEPIQKVTLGMLVNEKIKKQREQLLSSSKNVTLKLSK